MIPNNVLSKTLTVPPLKDGEIAKFRLLNTGKKEAGRDEPTTSKVYLMSEQQDVTDPFDKDNPAKTIGNVVGQIQARENGIVKKNPVDGSIIMVPRLQKVEFINGEKTVTSSEQATYQYLMRRKDNVSNPFRKAMGGKRVKELFMLESGVKELTDAVQLKDLQFIAARMVRECKDPTKIKAICLKLNASPDKRVHITSYVPGVNEKFAEIKLELINKCDQFPKLVIDASDDFDARLRVHIYESMRFGVLIFNEGSYWMMGGKEKNAKIYEPKADEDPMEGLIAHFKSEKSGGPSQYQEMAQTLNKVLKG